MRSGLGRDRRAIRWEEMVGEEYAQLGLMLMASALCME